MDERRIFQQFKKKIKNFLKFKDKKKKKKAKLQIIYLKFESVWILHPEISKF